MSASGREEKLAAALRENLKRRKARARALAAEAKDAAPAAHAPPPPESRPNIAARKG